MGPGEKICGQYSYRLETGQLPKDVKSRASLVARELRTHLLMQGTRVQSLPQEDPTSCGVTAPMSHATEACPHALELCSTTASLHDEKPEAHDNQDPHWPQIERLACSSEDLIQPKNKSFLKKNLKIQEQRCPEPCFLGKVPGRQNVSIGKQE